VKILWISPTFLHPTNKGGRIRSLEMLRRLHRRHEIHFAALVESDQPEGPSHSSEYCSRSYPVEHQIPNKRSLAFMAQLMLGLFSPMPVPIGRYCSPAMRRLLTDLLRQQRFDCVVCDFLSGAANIDTMERCVLFEHNVECIIWQRRAEQAPDPARRFYLRLHAQRMMEYERRVCRSAAHIVAVSPIDAQRIRNLLGAPQVSDIPTGVDVDFFCGPSSRHATTDLVFVGAMDWTPNVEAMEYFIRDVLPLIRRHKPDCAVAIVGRSPGKRILELAERDSKIRVTGTVPDVRPYLWGSRVAIVPLRAGGGTRIKIFEAMAAGVPVVSTSVGAEGLSVSDGENILIADTAEGFAERCLELLNDSSLAARLASAAREMVATCFSWDQVTGCFERVLENHRR
jgi:glycosyltransferase involved in cell wall biosynthesis